MDKLKKWYKNHFTTQLWIYVVLLSFGILLCLFPLSCKGKGEGEFFSGIGSGIIASVIVSISIDYGNTKLQLENEKKQFLELNAEYRYAFGDLREAVVRAYEQRFGYIDKQRHFTGWLDEALNFDDADDALEELTSDERFDIVWEIESAIIRIKRVGIQLQQNLTMYLNLPDNTSEYRRHVKHVIIFCGYIEKHFDNEEYARGASMIKRQLIPSFIENHPTYKDSFEEPYSMNGEDEDQ